MHTLHGVHGRVAVHGRVTEPSGVRSTVSGVTETASTSAAPGSVGDDVGADAPRPLALSPSRAADFKQCPLLYRFRAIDRLPEVPSAAQVRGTLVHAVLDRLYALPAAQRVRSAAQALVAPTWTQLCAADPTLAARSQAGFATTGAHMVDGSGLSTDDKVPAKLLSALLAAAAAPSEGPDDTQFLRPIVTGLPVAGGDGTLDDRFGASSPAAAGRGVVRAKTGTLTGVSSLAGITTDADGRLLVFALMSNDVVPSVVRPGLERPALDSIAAKLSRCGCR